jgi:hypothetical protein
MYLAYLDPGTGSMLAAAVVAGFAGLAVVVKTWWRRMFRRRSPEAETPAGPGQDG